MSSEAIRPSTLDGIKRLAKSLKIERGIQHVRALDEAAQSAGFQNFRHARNALRERVTEASSHPGHRVFITVYWRDRKAGGDGRETVTVTLTSPWEELIARTQLRNHRALVHFRREGPDHLARWHLAVSQSHARGAASAAARALQFMDATRLRPSGSRGFYSRGRLTGAVPGQDHESIWYAPHSKRYLLADEPYDLEADRMATERAAWAQRNGYVIAQPTWPGMYNPQGGSRLYLIADAREGIPLAPITEALNNLPPPIVDTPWNGDSAPTLPPFVSPGAIAEADAARMKPQEPRKPSGQRNSVRYIQAFVGPQLRPKGRMPIEAHTEVGRLLKSVLADTYNRKGVYNRVDAIRCELDDWTQCEYKSAELPNEQFFELYYHSEPGSTAPRSLPAPDRDRHVGSLTQARKVLVGHYPDCPPLRSLLKKVDAAIASMRSWAS